MKFRKFQWTGHVFGMREKRNIYRTLVEEEEMKMMLKCK
jgi:hypothetical protein